MKPAKLELDGGKVIYIMAEASAGEVDIRVCDKDGVPVTCGRLLAIRTDGLYRYPGILESIGLPLNAEEKLKKAKE